MPWDRRPYDRERYEQRVKEVHAILGGKCSACGATEDLEAHHIDPTTKSFTIKKSLSRNWQQTLRELEKCELLCEVCHNRKHETTHGQMRMYQYGCRCELCKAKSASMNAVYRKRYRDKLRALGVKSLGYTQ